MFKGDQSSLWVGEGLGAQDPVYFVSFPPTVALQFL